MNILFLTTNAPYPLDQGSRLRSFHLLRELSKSHSVYLLALSRVPIPEAVLSEFRSFCTEVHCIYRPRRSLQMAWDVFESFLKATPYTALASRDRELHAKLSDLIAKRSIDCIQMEELYPALNLPDSVACPPVIFDAHNCESLILKRTAVIAETGIHRLVNRLQGKWMHTLEQAMVARSAAVFAVSRQEVEMFAAQHSNVHYVPNGVPAIAPPIKREGATLLFTGTLKYPPNFYGLKWFLEEVFPLVQKVVPAVELKVVGREPPAALRAHEGAAVRFLPNCNDIRPELETSSIAIVPLQAGAGTRLKILEAFATRMPVVSTTIGAEGLDAKPGQQYLQADTAQDFSEAVLRLLSSAELREEIGSQAVEFVEQNFLWSDIVKRILPVYEELLP